MNNVSVVKPKFQSILLKKEEIIKDFEANVSGKTKQWRGANNFIKLVSESEEQKYTRHRANAAGKNTSCHPEDLDGKFLQIKIIFPAKEHNLPSATTYKHWNWSTKNGS